jgi:hypothetical protein
MYKDNHNGSYKYDHRHFKKFDRTQKRKHSVYLRSGNTLNGQVNFSLKDESYYVFCADEKEVGRRRANVQGLWGLCVSTGYVHVHMCLYAHIHVCACMFICVLLGMHVCMCIKIIVRKKHLRDNSTIQKLGNLSNLVNFILHINSFSGEFLFVYIKIERINAWNCFLNEC